ncbi:hypothetical protein ABIC71_003057 [Herbaspirillum seropedicae]|uniref:FRG domain-containing protein n=1 Tax=Herbaspirillum seropedicae TaxID=964 RepID=UPI003396FF7E
MNQNIESVDCETLDEFWSEISPIGKRFGRQNFIFRGQPNATWQLVPSIYRRQIIQKYKRGMSATLADHPGQAFFEWMILNSFVRYCDGACLAIPGESQEFRDYFDAEGLSRHGRDSNGWPEKVAWPLIAMAQHHGIPTRLLDWTKNPLIAAYFAAASGLTEEYNDEDRIAVFALDPVAVRLVNGLKMIRVPGRTSANLSAQNGLFILVENSGFRAVEFTPDVSLESKLTIPGLLQKITLPKSQVGHLLQRCNVFGISAASIYPGPDGAAKAALEALMSWNYEQAMRAGM